MDLKTLSIILKGTIDANQRNEAEEKLSQVLKFCEEIWNGILLKYLWRCKNISTIVWLITCKDTLFMIY